MSFSCSFQDPNGTLPRNVPAGMTGIFRPLMFAEDNAFKTIRVLGLLRVLYNPFERGGTKVTRRFQAEEATEAFSNTTPPTPQSPSSSHIFTAKPRHCQSRFHEKACTSIKPDYWRRESVRPTPQTECWVPHANSHHMGVSPVKTFEFWVRTFTFGRLHSRTKERHYHETMTK